MAVPFQTMDAAVSIHTRSPAIALLACCLQATADVNFPLGPCRVFWKVSGHVTYYDSQARADSHWMNAGLSIVRDYQRPYRKYDWTRYRLTCRCEAEKAGDQEGQEAAQNRPHQR